MDMTNEELKRKADKGCKRCHGQGWYMSGYYGAKQFECSCTKQALK